MGRSCFLKKGDVYTNFTMPIFCASPNSITSPSFRCWSIPVSEIREFNRKKEKEKKKNQKVVKANLYYDTANTREQEKNKERESKGRRILSKKTAKNN